MCDEHVDIWDQHWRIARKEHNCCECGHSIKSGIKYLSIKTLYEGQWDRYALCMVCEAHWEFYRNQPDSDGCILLNGLHEEEYNCEAWDKFVIIDSNNAELMKEQYVDG